MDSPIELAEGFRWPESSNTALVRPRRLRREIPSWSFHLGRRPFQGVSDLGGRWCMSHDHGPAKRTRKMWNTVEVDIMKIRRTFITTGS